MEQEDCLLYIGKNVINNGKIASEGTKGAWGDLGAGGSSGGGSINIFYNKELIQGVISSKGGDAVTGCKNGANSGAGGAGTITQYKIEINK